MAKFIDRILDSMKLNDDELEDDFGYDDLDDEEPAPAPKKAVQSATRSLRIIRRRRCPLPAASVRPMWFRCVSRAVLKYA